LYSYDVAKNNYYVLRTRIFLYLEFPVLIVNRHVAEDFSSPLIFSSIMKRRKRARKLKFMTKLRSENNLKHSGEEEQTDK